MSFVMRRTYFNHEIYHPQLKFQNEKTTEQTWNTGMEDDLFPLICNTSREMNTCRCKSQSLWACYATWYHLVYQFLNVSALLCCSHKELQVSLQVQAFISQSWTYSLAVAVFCFAWPNVFLVCDLSWRNSFCWGHDILISDPGVKEVSSKPYRCT